MSKTKAGAKWRLHIRTIAQMARTMWGIAKWHIMLYAAGAMLEIVGTLVSMYATAQLAALLARYAVERGGTGAMWQWLWVDIGCAAVIAIGFWLMKVGKRITYFRTVSWAMYTMQQSVSRLDIQQFDDPAIRSQINKVSAGYTWQMSNLAQQILDFLYSLVRFAAITAIVAQISWWLIPLLVLFLLPSMFAEAKVNNLQWFVWDEEGDNRYIFWGFENLLRRARAQMELRSLQARHYVLRKLNDMNVSFYGRQERYYLRLSRIIGPIKIVEIGGIAIGSVYLLYSFIHGGIQLEEYFFLSAALLRIGGALNAVFGSATYLQEPLVFAESYFALVTIQPAISDKSDALVLKSTIPPKIVFDKVSFHYPGKKKEIFKNLSFTICPGEHLAIVGENGAGKTTIIKLLLRFYQPVAGRILIDGHDLNDIAIESWYARLATLFQSYNEYPTPVKENIAIGRSDKPLDMARVRSAAAQSDIGQLVEKMPYGWETVLDSSFAKGIDPSGGQWQRVALARAFYRDASMLILDEPTSAIDAKAEYAIFNNIFSHYQDRSAIIISHRFSTVRRANRIIVLDEGEIVEQGSHAELMAQKGLYHELFTKQAEGYQD